MFKWGVRIIGILCVAVVLAVGALLLLPADRVAKLAADQIRAATGRDVAISGDVSLSIWPILGASVGEIEIGNADWSEDGPMLTAKNAAVGIDAAALLRGQITIRNIEATAPTIRLETLADGRANWQFTDASGTAQIETSTDPNRPTQPFSLQQMRIQDATLIYDAEEADLIRYEGVDLTLDWPSPEAAAQIKATLHPTDVPVTIDATIGAFSTFLAGTAQEVTASLTSAVGKAAFKGQAALSGDVAGHVSMNWSNTDAFLKALALPGADLPKSLGQSISAEARIDLSSDRRLKIRDLSVDLGGNRLSGKADISLNGVPEIFADLDAGPLDLTQATASTEGQAGSEAAPRGWSKAPIDASGLAAFNGEIALRAASVNLGSLKLGPTRTLLRNDRSRLVFHLVDVQAYEGRLAGEFVMNNRNGLSVGGNLSGDALALKPLLGDLAGVNRLSGQANGRMQFLGVGQSVDAIMRSLSGQGSLSTGRGTIEGINLDALMRSGDASGGTTVFDSLSASYTMAGGNLSNEDLLLSLPSLEARGAGRVGLGAQDIDYTFTPKALRVNGSRGLSIPVNITGPWAGPKIRPDLEAALELNFAEEAKELETKVEQKVQQKVEEALGVQSEEGQSVEDVLEKKLEKEVGNALRKLFD